MGIGDEVRRDVEEGADDGLMEAARTVLARAIAQLPIGDPAQDPDPAVALRTNNDIRHVAPNVVEVVFHGPYAAAQHEAQHWKHPRGGKPKFLEDALKTTIPEFERIVAGEVRKNLSPRRR